MTRPLPGPAAISCPKCGASEGKHCRTLTTNRVTDTHEARWIAWVEAGRPRRREADD